MTPEDLKRLDAAEARFAALTVEMHERMRNGDLRDSSLVVE